MSEIDRQAAERLVAVGLLEADQLAAAQQDAQKSGRALGRVLVESGLVDATQMENARAAVAERVRFCARCDGPVAVPRLTAQGEVCPTCLGPVEWRSGAKQPVLQTEGEVALVDEEVPPEVLVARADRERIFGKYILLSQAGQGGVGEVHRAWDTYMGEHVALKFIRERQGETADEESRKEEIALLLKEARAMIRLRHENIVAIRDVGRVNRQYFIAMDYVDGNTLADHIAAAAARGRPSPLYENPAFYVRCMLQVALAVNHAHTLPQPIVHCDLKPANVMIGLDGTAYVMDFGIARILGGSDDQPELAGTPSFMAPEQATRGGRIGPWTDVYGLGAMLYTLLCGRPMFVGEPVEVLRRLLEETPPLPSEVLAGTSSSDRESDTRARARLTLLEAACMQCLRKEPSKRFASALELAERLETVLNALESEDTALQSGMVPTAVRAAQREARFREMDSHLTGLQLERALEEATRIESRNADADVRSRLSGRRRHAEVIGALRGRLVERLNTLRPRLRALDLQSARLADVEIMKATSEKLVVFHKQSALEVPWTALTAPQIVALAEVAGLQTDEDRFGLLVFCRLARLDEPARKLARLLEGTKLADEARHLVAE